MKLNVKVGDVIVSGETSKAYKVIAIQDTEYECIDLEGHGRTWLYKHMVTDKKFYKEEM